MGWVYNLKDENAPTEAPRLIAICLSFATAAIFATALRFYVRLTTNRGLWVDDYATLSSALLACGYAAVAVVQTRWGQALDPAYFPPENVVPFSKVQYVGGPIYTLALLGFKISLLTSYLRIGGFVRLYKYIIYAAIAAVTCNQIIFTLVISLACHPVSKQWDSNQPGWCIDTVASYYAIAGTSLGFDLIIIILPLPVLWKLQLHLKQKLVLCALFALGFFITAIQIVRIFTIANLRTYTDSQSIVMWSSVEIGLGVIITCIPTYGPLFAAFSSRINSYRTRRRHGSYRLTSSPTRRSKSGRGSHLDTPRTGSGTGKGMDFVVDDRGTSTTVAAASSSEERILPYEYGLGSPVGIHAKTEIRVEGVES